MTRIETPCRVAHIVNRMDHGVAAHDLIKALDKHTTIESTVLSLQQPTRQPDGIQVEYPKVANTSSRLSMDRLTWLKNAINEFDVITTYHTLSGVFGAIFAKTQGVGIVAREGNDHRRFPFKVRATRTVTGLLADRIVCVSQSVADSYQGFERVIPESKFTVIQNCVDIDAVQQAATHDWSIYDVANISSDAYVVGTVGMLVEQKNHETLIRSIGELTHDRLIDVELVIAGSGPRKKFLQDVAVQCEVSDRIHFLGYLERQQVYKMLHEINCYSMPSRWEGFSAAVLQAMAAGVPCVLSDIPSFRSQYPDSAARFHSTESIAQIKREIFETLSANDDLGKNGYEFVSDNHSSVQMAEKYEQLYLKN